MASGDAPRSFLCPITLEVMSDPVLCAKSGYTYERSAIESAIASNAVDPMTRARITRADLVPNRALKDQIDAWREARGGSVGGGGTGSLEGRSSSSRVIAAPSAAPCPPLALSATVFPAAPALGDAPLLSITLSGPDDPVEPAERRILAIVIDTSGSMGDAAKAAAPGAEEDGLSRLDLAKHSALTLIEALGDDVRGGAVGVAVGRWWFVEHSLAFISCEAKTFVPNSSSPEPTGPPHPRELFLARDAPAPERAHDGCGQGARPRHSQGP